MIKLPNIVNSSWFKVHRINKELNSRKILKPKTFSLKPSYLPGSLMVIAMIFLFFVVSISVAVFAQIQGFVSFGADQTLKQQAVNVSDAGLNWAIWQINQGNLDPDVDPLPVFESFGDAGEFEINVENLPSGNKKVTSTGYVPDFLTRKIKVKSQVEITTVAAGTSFPFVFHAGTGGIDIRPADGNWDTPPGTEGDVFSNAPIVGNGGNPGFDVEGDAYSTSTINAGINISGTTNENHMPPQDIPEVDIAYWEQEALKGGEIPATGCCYNATVGPNKINGSVEISGGNTTISGALHITGDLTLNSGVELSLSTDFANSGTGTVIIVDDDIKIEDGAKINATGVVDGQKGFIMFVSKRVNPPTPRAIDIDGIDGGSRAIYYAKNGEVRYAIDDDITHGAIAANEITHMGDATFKYDPYTQNAQFSPTPTSSSSGWEIIRGTYKFIR